MPSNGRTGAPAPPAAAVLALLLLQIALLTTGISRDYRLKHEDNNALHATFARSHLALGLETTRGQNYFHNVHTGTGLFYPNHPAGPALALAGVFGLTGSDGPFVTRATAIAFHLAGTWLFYGLARRLLRHRWEVLLALTVYALVPESAFFGRMMNHEVMVLPAGILLVRGYWESVRGEWSSGRWIAAVAVGGTFGVVSGWAGFFVIGACVVHAFVELVLRRNRRAAAPLFILIVGGLTLFAAVIAHLLWSAGTGTSYLRGLLASRSVADAGGGTGQRIARVLELHWRYFSLTSLVALLALAFRAVRGLRGGLGDAADDVGAIFLLAGAGYVATFSVSASRHDYWQFMLLPAAAIAIAVAARHVLAKREEGRLSWQWRAVVALAVLEMTATTAATLIQRHTKGEGYCIEVVAGLRRDYL